MEYIVLIIVGLVGLLFGAKKFSNNFLKIEILKEFIPSGNHNRPGTPITPSKITIHNTGNEHTGTGARWHSNLVRNNYEHSWHFTVDDTLIIQQLPLDEKGWHSKLGNSKSIGIEICMHPENDQNKANENAAKLTAYLLKKIGAGIEDIVTHRSWTLDDPDGPKPCPALLLSKWDSFKEMVQSYYSSGVKASHKEGEGLDTARLGILPDTEMCWEGDGVKA